MAYHKCLCRFENFLMIPTQERTFFLIYFAQGLPHSFFIPPDLLSFLVSGLF